MVRKAELGELEHLVLLAALRLGGDAYAPAIAELLEEHAGRELSRGTLYAALDRLETRGLLTWSIAASPARAGHRRRRFRVTRTGVAVLRASRQALFGLWDGLEHRLGEQD
jgi:DNA-binding PadR family transcriptional regulator